MKNHSLIQMQFLSKDFMDKVQRTSWKDVLHIFQFAIALPIALIYRRFRKNLWLLAEYGEEARDNAYWLFKYIRQEHPTDDVVYAIDPRSEDFYKVKCIGKTVSYGTLLHWIFYLTAQANISSQKGGKPNAAVCYILEVSGILKNTRVLLQHGIILNDTRYLHYKYTKLRLFICGAKPEYNFVRSRFGYPPENVVCAGMCRYDALIRDNRYQNCKTILVIPTWRKWIAHNPIFHGDNAGVMFQNTDYFKIWNSFLNSERLSCLLKKYSVRIVFCPHRNMEQFVKFFSATSPFIEIVFWHALDIRKAINSSSLLITDYSSISVDFAYTGKGLIYYQYDASDFHSRHLEVGYFDYVENGFGQVCVSEEQLIDKIDFYIKNDFNREEIYNRRTHNFFAYYDNKNCERNYVAIKNIL